MVQRFIIKKHKNKHLRSAYINNKYNNKDMKNNEEDIKMVEDIINGDSTKTLKRKVKIEKKDKGLIERTEDSTIVLTEDNKRLLND